MNWSMPRAIWKKVKNRSLNLLGRYDLHVRAHGDRSREHHKLTRLRALKAWRMMRKKLKRMTTMSTRKKKRRVKRTTMTLLSRRKKRRKRKGKGKEKETTKNIRNGPSPLHQA